MSKFFKGLLALIALLLLVLLLITSNVLKVNTCDLAGTCIDILDTGSGKLFTNSPSVAYLDSLGGNATNVTATKIEEDYGPASDFYIYTLENAKKLCAAYNTEHLGGRTNWRLATEYELKQELYDKYGNMITERGWPTFIYYWSVAPDGSSYYNVGLSDGHVISSDLSRMSYASCVSES